MASATLVYDPAKGLGPVDKVLLRGAASRKSPKELSALTNGVLKPAEAAARVEEILDSRDWLSQAQMKMLLIDDMMNLKDILTEKVGHFDKDAYKPLISILTLIDKTLAADKFDLTKAMTEISRAHAQLLLSAVSLAFERAMLELEKLYPEVQKSVLQTVLHESLPEAMRVIESRIPTE